jgi:hypothetical protein
MAEICGIPSTVAKLSGQRLMQRHSLREERSKCWPLSLAERLHPQRVQQTQCFSDKARCADSKVLTNNMVMVIGPTPPGTGVM